MPDICHCRLLNTGSRPALVETGIAKRPATDGSTRATYDDRPGPLEGRTAGGSRAAVERTPFELREQTRRQHRMLLLWRFVIALIAQTGSTEPRTERAA